MKKNIYIETVGSETFSKKMIISKMRDLGFEGEITESMETADKVIFWVGNNITDEEQENMVDSIIKYAPKAIIGCWPYSNAFRLCQLLNEHNIPTNLDELATSSVERLKMPNVIFASFKK